MTSFDTIRAALTENEREIALTVAAREGRETRKWLNLVLEAYDGRVAELDRLETALKEAEQANATIIRENGLVVTRVRKRAEAAEAALRETRQALQEIAANAEAWHGYLPESEHAPGSGHVLALKVIAASARAVLAGVEGQQNTT